MSEFTAVSYEILSRELDLRRGTVIGEGNDSDLARAVYGVIPGVRKIFSGCGIEIPGFVYGGEDGAVGVHKIQMAIHDYPSTSRSGFVNVISSRELVHRKRNSDYQPFPYIDKVRAVGNVHAGSPYERSVEITTTPNATETIAPFVIITRGISGLPTRTNGIPPIPDNMESTDSNFELLATHAARAAGRGIFRIFSGAPEPAHR